MATDLIEKTRNELEARLEELRPLVDEANRLQRALDALTGAVGEAVARSAGSVAGAADAVADRFGGEPASKRSSGRRSSGNGRRRGASSSSGRKPGRRKGSGTRAAQANDLVKKRPGITIPELAQEMGIKQNYLYRVMPGLQEEGKVVKRDKGWHPA